MSKRKAAIQVLCLYIVAGVSARAGDTADHPLVPFWFVENRGQSAPSVRYIGNGSDFRAWFQDQSVVLGRGNGITTISFMRDAVAENVTIRPGQPTGAKANYMFGSDPRYWHSDLPIFDSIHYLGLWPGIELIYRADQGHLKAEYIVSPRANAADIRLRMDAATEILPNGSLLVHTQGGEFVEEKPYIYQTVAGERKTVSGGFRNLADGSIGFWTGDYDFGLPLAIDPAILISGYWGGSGQDSISAVAIDSLKNIVVAGSTTSNNLPTSRGQQTKYGGNLDAFVASFFPNGGGLNYCTYLGGSGQDQALGLALDSSRNAYITGSTTSPNFPLLNPIQTRLSGTRDAFVAKLSASGSSLIYSSYLGGSGAETGYAIALNSSNSAVVVGDTTSTNFPVTAPAFQTVSGGSQDVFIAVVSPAGNSLMSASYLGGNGVDHATSVVVGPSGGIYVGGYTWSLNFPVLNALQPHSGGGQDGFVAKMYQGNLLWSTYLGGAGGSVGAPEAVTSMSINSSAILVAAGTTSSKNFPVTSGVFQATFDGETDGFVTRIGPAGNLLQSTYLGGALGDSIIAATVDFCGNIYVAGSTSSLDFPVQWPLQSANAGSMDAFVVKMNSTLTTVLFGTYLGGTGNDQASAIAIDAETSIVVAGQTSSPDYPISGTMQNFQSAMLTSFITKIRPNFTLGVAYPYAGQMEFTADPWHVMTDTASTFYGLSTDVAVVGDWTGTGVKRIGIFRNGTWILDTNGNGIIDGADKTVVFGQAGDKPIVGDWRGTGNIALGLYRNGSFILDLSGHLSGVATGLSDVTYSGFGLPSDIPVAADWSGTRTTKVGVFRNGTWLVDYNGNGTVSNTFTFGQIGDFPVVGDWDSSGISSKIGVYRSGLWILDYAGDHVLTTPGSTEMSLGFGFTGYTPLVF